MKNKKLQKHTQSVYFITKDTIISYINEGAYFHGAALAYYALFSLFPLLYLSISFFSRFIEQKKIISIIEYILTKKIGINNIDGIINYLNASNFREGNLWYDFISLIFLIFISSSFFVSLRRSINEYFGFKASKSVKKTSFIRLFYIVFTGLFSAFVIFIYIFQFICFSWLSNYLSSHQLLHVYASHFLDYFLSILTNYFIFLFVFKYMHDGFISWKVCKRGAMVTAFLLFIGQLLIKFYLENYFFLGSSHIIGSLFIFLAWVHFSSQIIFIGTKFCFIYALRIKNPIIQS